MTKLALGAMALLTLTAEARAAFMDGNALHADCTSNNYVERGTCLGYVEGVVDNLDEIRSAQNVRRCIPDGTVGHQVVDVVVNYLREHPEGKSYAASSLVIFAVLQAWNCK
jgi:hypothetical protein